MTLRHRVEKRPRLHQVVNDLVYGLIDPSAMLAEICHLGKVYITERRSSDHIDERPSRSGKGRAPRVQRSLCLSGTCNCETGKRNCRMLQTSRLLLQSNQGPLPRRQMKLEISPAVHEFQSLADQLHQQFEQLDVDVATFWTGSCVPKRQSLLTPQALQGANLWQDQDSNEICLFSSAQLQYASFTRSLHDVSPGSLTC